MRFAMLGLLITLPTLGPTPGVSAAGEIPLGEVPRAVLEAVKAKFPVAELKKAETETEDDATIFEVALELEETNVEVALTPEGTILEIETEIAAADLPEAVSEAIRAKYPAATPKKVERVVAFKDGEESKSFEVLLAIGDEDRLELTLSESGKILEEEEADDDGDEEDEDEDDDDNGEDDDDDNGEEDDDGIEG